MNSTDRKVIKLKHKRLRKAHEIIKYSTDVVYAQAEITPRFRLVCSSIK